MPSFLQSIAIANRFDAVVRMAKPPFIIQKIAFIVLLPFAWLCGYKAVDTAYID
jgi:hypothetical protein